MRNLLALVGLAVIGFGGLGWYMGWYKLNVAKSSDGNIQITTDVDAKKVTSDSSEFLKNVSTVIGSHVDKAGQDAKTATPNTAPGGTPGPITNPQTAPPVPGMPVTPVAPGPIPLKAPKSN